MYNGSARDLGCAKPTDSVSVRFCCAEDAPLIRSELTAVGARFHAFGLEQASSRRSLIKSQARSLLSIAKLNRARSRHKRAHYDSD
jgi:hypothetical protein